MLVSGPRATSVTGWSEAAAFSARKSFACPATRAVLGGGRSTPSSPVSPCASAATTSSPASGPVRAGGDADVRSARELEHAERVRGRLVECLVPRDRRHAEDVELRAAQGEKERERVVLARVAVDEDRDHARCVRAGRRSRH